MKMTFKNIQVICFSLLTVFILNGQHSHAQCVNADFENGDFTGWTATWGLCEAPLFGGINTCEPWTGWPYLNTGFSQGTNNAAINAPEHHFIMTSGFDANVGGSSLPVVNPNGGTTSMRLGTDLTGSGIGGTGRGETVSYSFVVDASNSNFTYNYAVVLNDAGGGHTVEGQPYFKISMTANGTNIACAGFDVNGSTANTIGGFTQVGSDILWKPWSAVNIPLKDFIGQTVKITFETRNCRATSGPGTHWAYAYIDADCSPLEIIPSAPSVCSGQSITLTAPDGAASYSWTGPTAGSIVSGGSSNVATVNAPGTYTVTMTTMGAAPCTYDLTVTMPPNLAGSGVTVNSATICAGESATLTASGGAPYTWAPGGETTDFITVSPGSTTSYSVSGGTCPSTGEGIVTVNPIPDSPFTVTPVCVDEGSTITYTGTGPPTANYTWDFAGGTVISGSGQGPFSVSWPSSGTPNVTLTVAVGTCVSPLSTVPVTVNPAPIVTITPATICIGTSGTITAAGASSYVWSDASTAASLSDSPLITTTYSVTGTSAGCSGTASGSITVNPLQDPTFSYTPSTICKTGGADPTPSITSPGGSFSASPAGLVINASNGVVDLASSNLGTYTITYTTAGPCPDVSTFDISLVNIPVADFTLGEYCQNLSTNPSPTYGPGASAGVFTSASGLVFVSPVSTPGEINLSASTPGNYTVTNTISAGGGCPSAIATNTISINPVPITSVDDQPICSGGTATLTASGADAYSWSDASTATTLTASPSTTTSYTVTGTSTGCSSTAVGTITVNPIPTSPFTTTPVCEGIGSAITYTGNAPANAVYTWDFAGGTVLSGSGQGPYSVSWPSSGTQNIALTVTIGACVSPLTTVPVTINPYPVVTVNDPAICIGNTATLTAAGADAYVWSDGSTASTLSVTPGTSTTYTVTGTSLGCSSSDEATVTITALPVISVNSSSICFGESATLTASGGSILDWSTGDSGPSITVTPTMNSSYTVSDNTPGCSGFAVGTVTVNPLPTVSVNQPIICEGETSTLTASGASTYAWSNGSSANPLTIPLATTATYTVIGTDINTCKDTAISSITVNPNPTVMVNSDSICLGLSSTLTASGASSYTWSNGATGESITVTPSSGTLYNVTVTGTNTYGCTDSDVSSITLFRKPTAQFNSSPSPAQVYDPVVYFNNQSSADVTYWFWSFGDGDTLSPNTPNPMHTYPGDTATYNVMLKVHNAGFCYDSINHLVLIGPEFSFYIPNAFTPDGDGINDLFFGSGVGIVEYELAIFDRWGNFIFQTDDLHEGWDGKANGGAEKAQQDVYVWKVDLTDIFKKKHNYIGTVTIVRGY